MDSSTLEQIESLVTSCPSPPRAPALLSLPALDISPPHTRREEEESLSAKFLERTESLLGRRKKEPRGSTETAPLSPKPASSPRLKARSRTRIYSSEEKGVRLQKEAWVGPLDWADGGEGKEKDVDVVPKEESRDCPEKDPDSASVPCLLEDPLAIEKAVLTKSVENNLAKDEVFGQQDLVPVGPYMMLPCEVMDKLEEIKQEPEGWPNTNENKFSEVASFKGDEERGIKLKEDSMEMHQASESSESLCQVFSFFCKFKPCSR